MLESPERLGGWIVARGLACVGLAVVRSVNEADNCVFLLSNVEEDVIREVKTLCLGKLRSQ